MHIHFCVFVRYTKNIDKRVMTQYGHILDFIDRGKSSRSLSGQISETDIPLYFLRIRVLRKICMRNLS